VGKEKTNSGRVALMTGLVLYILLVHLYYRIQKLSEQCLFGLLTVASGSLNDSQQIQLQACLHMFVCVSVCKHTLEGGSLCFAYGGRNWGCEEGELLFGFPKVTDT
jgi:hypothetical protein